MFSLAYESSLGVELCNILMQGTYKEKLD